MQGSLGIRSIGKMNEALLTKLAWRILQNPSSLLAKVFKTKYKKDKGWWPCSKSASASLVWKGLHTGLNSDKNNACWAIGLGTSVSLVLDPWEPGSPS